VRMGGEFTGLRSFQVMGAGISAFEPLVSATR
jgi:hypothetical protein